MSEEFIKVYDEHFDSIYRYTYSKVSNKWDTDDIVSEVFRKAYEKYGSGKDNSRAWIFAIAKNAITDHYRRNKHQTLALDELFLFEEGLVEDGLIEEVSKHCLKQALSGLCEEEYDLIALRYFADLKYDEISRLSGKPGDSLRVKASRTIRKLRDLVNKCMEG